MDTARIRAALLLMVATLARLADSEASPSKVDEPIPVVNVTSVSGYTASLPCNLSLSEEIIMVLWYRSEDEGSPIYSVDGRNQALSRGKHWSNPRVLADRAQVQLKPGQALLRIDRLAPEDAGLYRCRIDFRNNPTRNQRVNLTVVVPPQQPVIHSNNQQQTYSEGGELMLECRVTGGSPPPRLTWHRGDVLLDDTFHREHADGEVVVNQLNLYQVTRDLSGAVLVCRANNTHLVKPASAEIKIDVNLKPLVVNITNKTPFLSALKTYEIKCVSWGSKPEAVITWWKGPHQVKHMARNFINGTKENTNVTWSILSYVPTSVDDEKSLTCRAENPMVPNSALEEKWPLSIHYVPVVTISLGSNLNAGKITEGDAVYFECEVLANPKTNRLTWLKNGRELQHNPAASVIMPGDKLLVLQKVSRASAGEYACTAVNDEGRTTSKPVTLDVMYAPVCKDGATTQVVGALKHETISLVCGVQSKPAPTTFQWTFNNSGELKNMPASGFAQDNPQHLITNHWHGSRLNYTPGSDVDYGTIACQATNQIGVQKVPCLFQIIAAGKPYPLQNCSALQSTGPYAYRMGHEDFKTTDARDADWLIVSCSEGFDGGLPITSFELEVYSDESVYYVNTIYINHTDKASGGGGGGGSSASISGANGGNSGPIFEVPGLEPGRNYRLLLYAVNGKGRSDPVVLEPVTLKGVAMYTTGRDSNDDKTDYSLLVACFAGGATAICILVVGVTLTLYRRNHPLHLSKTQTHLVHCPSTAAIGAGGNVDAHNSIVATDDRQLVQQQQQQLHMQLAQHTQQARQEYELLQRRTDILKDPPRHPLDVFARTSSSLTPTSTTAALSSSPNLRGGLVLVGGYDQSAEDDPDVIPSTKAERRPDIFEPNYAPKPERIKDFRRHLQDEDLNYHATLTASTSQQLHQQHQPLEKDSWLRQNGGCQVVTSPGASPTTRPSGAQDVYTRSLKVQESCI